MLLVLNLSGLRFKTTNLKKKIYFSLNPLSPNSANWHYKTHCF